jgi:hypothetical protein
MTVRTIQGSSLPVVVLALGNLALRPQPIGHIFTTSCGDLPQKTTSPPTDPAAPNARPDISVPSSSKSLIATGAFTRGPLIPGRQKKA